MIEAGREAQLLVLVAVFLLASAGKFHEGKDLRSVIYAVIEAGLCLMLLVSSHDAVRLVTLMVLVAATWMLGELRTRNPYEGCGCFGALSSSRIGRRTVVRTGLLAIAAALTLGLPHSGLQVAGEAFGWRGVIFLLELGALVAISPETGALLKRTRVPCERRPVPLRDTLAVLHASEVWAKHGVGDAEPAEVWRELCWRFLVYPVDAGELVFAVSLADREVRVALVEEATSEVNDTGPNPAYVLV